MTRSIRALIFDMDGTLYQSEALDRQYADAVVGYVAEQRGVSPETAVELFRAKRAEIESRLGRKPTTTGTMVGLGFNLDQWIAWRDARVRPEDLLRRDAALRSLLEDLKRRFMLVVVTNNSIQMAHRTLGAIGIDNLFDHTFTVQDIGLIKPDPEIYRRVAKAIGVSPGQCLSIGDRPHVDLEPAAAIGMQTFHAAGPENLGRLRALLALT
ncbi:MAG: HAD family hydrolase [Verrucomicrobia bacterium]|nr:HAD family hydrolase [Verrucomicrobiota bacterium]